ALVQYNYPGNVRELENLIERAVTLAPGDRLTRDTLPPMATSRHVPNGNVEDVSTFPDEGLDLERVVADFERQILLKALEKTGGNRTEAARLLGVTFRSLRYRLSKLGITGPDNADGAVTP